MTSDVEVVRHFYAEVFGWEAGEAAEEFGGYFQFFRAGCPVAGVMPSQSPGTVPDVWNVYIAVENAEETQAGAEAAGASVLAPAMRVGDLGTMAVIVDPSGAQIGIWAPLEFQGFAVIDEASAPRWFELQAREYERALDFYRSVFSWDTRTVSDVEEYRYATANHGDQSFAGLLDASRLLPEGSPGSWHITFGVESVDEAVAAAEMLGGTVRSPAEDTPWGRHATLSDPTGPTFTVMQY